MSSIGVAHAWLVSVSTSRSSFNVVDDSAAGLYQPLPAANLPATAIKALGRPCKLIAVLLRSNVWTPSCAKRAAVAVFLSPRLANQSMGLLKLLPRRVKHTLDKIQSLSEVNEALRRYELALVPVHLYYDGVEQRNAMLDGPQNILWAGPQN